MIGTKLSAEAMNAQLSKELDSLRLVGERSLLREAKTIVFVDGREARMLA